LMAMASRADRPRVAGTWPPPLMLHAYAPGGRVRVVEVTGGDDATAPLAAVLRRTGLPALYRSAGAAAASAGSGLTRQFDTLAGTGSVRRQ